jgi:hypothetical protein
VAAAFVLLGLAAGLSLLGQYWGILAGTEEYIDKGAPLLGDASTQVRNARAVCAVCCVQK